MSAKSAGRMWSGVGWTLVVNAERGALMVNPGRRISPDTMAIHHILDEQVAERLGAYKRPRARLD